MSNFLKDFDLSGDPLDVFPVLNSSFFENFNGYLFIRQHMSCKLYLTKCAFSQRLAKNILSQLSSFRVWIELLSRCWLGHLWRLRRPFLLLILCSLLFFNSLWSNLVTPTCVTFDNLAMRLTVRNHLVRFLFLVLCLTWCFRLVWRSQRYLYILVGYISCLPSILYNFCQHDGLSLALWLSVATHIVRSHGVVTYGGGLTLKSPILRAVWGCISWLDLDLFSASECIPSRGILGVEFVTLGRPLHCLYNRSAKLLLILFRLHFKLSNALFKYKN